MRWRRGQSRVWGRGCGGEASDGGGSAAGVWTGGCVSFGGGLSLRGDTDGESSCGSFGGFYALSDEMSVQDVLSCLECGGLYTFTKTCHA